MEARLSVKLRDAFVSVGATGTLVLNDGFVHLDRSINDDSFEADRWTFKRFLGPSSRLSDDELDVLFEECVRQSGNGHQLKKRTVLPPESATTTTPTRRGKNTPPSMESPITAGGKRDAGGDHHHETEHVFVDLAIALVYIRKLIGRKTQQLHDAQKKLRHFFSQSSVTKEAAGVAGANCKSKRDSQIVTNRAAGEIHAMTKRNIAAAMEKLQEMSRAELYDWMVSCGLTHSEAFLVLEASVDPVPEDDANSTPQAGKRRPPKDEDPEEGDQYDDDYDDERSAAPTDDEEIPESSVLARVAYGTLDTEYLKGALLEEDVPDDILYPLLVGKFVEAAADGGVGGFGSGNGAHHNGGFIGAGGAPGGASGVVTANMKQYTGSIGIATVLTSSRFSRCPRSATSASLVQSKHHDPNATQAPASATSKSARSRFGGDAEPAQHAATATKPTSKPDTSGVSSFEPLPLLDEANFRVFSSTFGCGLSGGEANVLFSFLQDPATGMVDSHQLIQLFQSKCPLFPTAQLQSQVCGIIRHRLLNAPVGVGGNSSAPMLNPKVSGLNLLHYQYCAFEDRTIPLDAFTAGFRKLGVPITVVPDILLEHLHRQCCSATPQEGLGISPLIKLIHAVRGPLPKPREALLSQLFVNLCRQYEAEQRRAGGGYPQGGTEDGTTQEISFQKLLESYMPDLAGPRLGTMPAERQSDLRRFLITLADPLHGGHATNGGEYHLTPTQLQQNISYPEFMYYWGNVAPTFEDDNTFQFFVWRSFGMQAGGSVGHQRGGGGSAAHSAARETSSSAHVTPRRGESTTAVASINHGGVGGVNAATGVVAPLHHISGSRRRVVPAPAVEDPSQHAGKPSRRKPFHATAI